MRPEAENWFRQAEADLANAQANVAPPSSYVAAFLVHQASEKALKAAFIAAGRELRRERRGLVALAVELGAPPDLVSQLREINADYVATRYSDAANGVPAENYDERLAWQKVGIAREVLRWARERMSISA